MQQITDSNIVKLNHHLNEKIKIPIINKEIPIMLYTYFLAVELGLLCLNNSQVKYNGCISVSTNLSCTIRYVIAVKNMDNSDNEEIIMNINDEHIQHTNEIYQMLNIDNSFEIEKYGYYRVRLYISLLDINDLYLMGPLHLSMSSYKSDNHQ